MVKFTEEWANHERKKNTKYGIYINLKGRTKLFTVFLCMFCSEKVVHCAVLTRIVALVSGLIGDALLQYLSDAARIL